MSAQAHPIIEFKSFRLPSDVDLLFRNDEPVALEPLAVRVLRYLAANSHRVVSKTELLEKIWVNVFTADDVLKRAISQIRKILDDNPKNPEFIKTFHGRGYQFVAQTTIKPFSVNGIFAAEAQSVNQRNVRVSLQNASAAIATDPNYNQLVGRDTEMAVLQAEFRSILKGQGSPILITGEAGIGKTQLARHFMQWAETQGAQCFYARFFDYQGHRLAPYEVFLNLLREAFATSILSQTDQSNDNNTSSIHPTDDLQTLAAHYGVTLPIELLTPKTPMDFETKALWANSGVQLDDAFRAVVPLSQCFIRLSQKQPLVLVLDDLQWADEASREVIGYLLRTAPSAQLMMIGLAREVEAAQSDNPFAVWLKRQASYRSYTALSLKTLPEEAYGQIISVVFGGDSVAPVVPQSDLKTLHRATNGNPYFLTEVLRLLIVEGVISFDFASPSAWKWKGVKDLPLPETLVTAARAKLDLLPAEDREVADCACVIGDEFRVETLAVIGGWSEQKIESGLKHLAQSGIVTRRGVTSGEDYRFYHTILRRVLYDSLPSVQRKRLHEQVANALQTVYGQEDDRIADAISTHYEAAENASKTFYWSMRASQAASSRWQWREALRCAERALRASEELAQAGQPVSPFDRLQLVLKLGEGYYSIGQASEAEAYLANALLMARQLNEVQVRARTLIFNTGACTDLSRYGEAQLSAQEALEIYSSLNDREGIRQALCGLCTIKISTGDYRSALEFSQRAFNFIEENTQASARVQALHGLSLSMLGEYENGLPLIKNAINYFARNGDVRQQAIKYYSLMFVYIRNGFYEEAIKAGRRARMYYHQIDLLRGKAAVQVLVGQARIEQGLFEEGIKRLTRAIENVRSHNSVHYEAKAIWWMGRAYSELGHFSKADQMLTNALTAIRQIGDQEDESLILVDIARLRLKETKSEEALSVVCQALSICEKLSQPMVSGVALVEKASCYQQLHQNKLFYETARQAVRLLEEARSANRWRAYWALGLAIEAASPKFDKIALKQALAELQRAVKSLENVCLQFGRDDHPRQVTSRKAHSKPAHDLRRLLELSGHHDEATALAKEWLLDESNLNASLIND